MSDPKKGITFAASVYDPIAVRLCSDSPGYSTSTCSAIKGKLIYLCESVLWTCSGSDVCRNCPGVGQSDNILFLTFAVAFCCRVCVHSALVRPHLAYCC